MRNMQRVTPKNSQTIRTYEGNCFFKKFTFARMAEAKDNVKPCLHSKSKLILAKL
jgi:hypothetical protein